MPDSWRAESDGPRDEQIFGRFLEQGGDPEGPGFEELCRKHADRASALRSLRAQWAELNAALPSGSGVTPPGDDDLGHLRARLLERYSGRSIEQGRYQVEGEVARGGMGRILVAFDEELRRRIAMKVVRAPANKDEWDTRSIGRFVEEAQVTAQLDHPGIVPVHELGLDVDGRPFFTMKLVRGETLHTVFEKVIAGVDGWTRVRALGVILKVCDAMSYAHAKGVIHRDLKPLNVMVGRFGEVYVMDWGLSRIQGHSDDSAARLTSEHSGDVRSDRRSEATDAESPLLTREGDVVGTPAYMSPEQARGELERIGPAADVYAVGAMIYELLAGQQPYVPRGARLSPYIVLRLLLEGPPQAVSQLGAAIAPELVAICERAMARNVETRYPSMSALGHDLRAFLEGRVVRAHATGPIAELRKWVGRNRGTAASFALLVFAVVAFLATLSVVQARARQRLAGQFEVLRQEARRSDETVEFLGQLLEWKRTSTLPGGGEVVAADISLADVLDRAELLLGVPARVDALSRAQRHALVGRAMLGVGDLERAQRHLEESRALVDEVGGRDPVVRGRILLDLSRLAFDRRRNVNGALQGAIELARDAKAAFRQAPERQHLFEVQASAWLGELLFATGELDASYEEMIAAFTVAKSSFEPEATPMSVYAELEELTERVIEAWRLGRRAEAAALLENYMVEYVDALGADPTLAMGIMAVGMYLQFYRSSAADADILYRLSLRLSRDIYGEAHPVRLVLDDAYDSLCTLRTFQGAWDWMSLGPDDLFGDDDARVRPPELPVEFQDSGESAREIAAGCRLASTGEWNAASELLETAVRSANGVLAGESPAVLYAKLWLARSLSEMSPSLSTGDRGSLRMARAEARERARNLCLEVIRTAPESDQGPGGAAAAAAMLLRTLVDDVLSRKDEVRRSQRVVAAMETAFGASSPEALQAHAMLGREYFKAGYVGEGNRASNAVAGRIRAWLEEGRYDLVPVAVREPFAFVAEFSKLDDVAVMASELVSAADHLVDCRVRDEVVFRVATAADRAGLWDLAREAYVSSLRFSSGVARPDGPLLEALLEAIRFSRNSPNRDEFAEVLGYLCQRTDWSARRVVPLVSRRTIHVDLTLERVHWLEEDGEVRAAQAALEGLVDRLTILERTDYTNLTRAIRELVGFFERHGNVDLGAAWRERLSCMEQPQDGDGV